MRANVGIQVAARQHTTWILSFKLRDDQSRLTCNDWLGCAPIGTTQRDFLACRRNNARCAIQRCEHLA